jgi:formylglycine-generating enzyme required for sulfatase activity
MGSRDYKEVVSFQSLPRHQVQLRQDYWLGKHPVTVQQFEQFCQQSGYNWIQLKPNTQGTQPVVGVSWFDARAFCNWLNDSEAGHGTQNKVQRPESLVGWQVGLPTEAEWERACRGAQGANQVEQIFGCGDDEAALTRVAWFGLQWEVQIPEVQKRDPTDWGLHDMHGLVWEWCTDLLTQADYSTRSALAVDPGAAERFAPPARPVASSQKGLRGGSWCVFAADCRSAIRVSGRAGDSSAFLGFRIALHRGLLCATNKTTRGAETKVREGSRSDRG